MNDWRDDDEKDGCAASGNVRRAHDVSELRLACIVVLVHYFADIERAGAIVERGDGRGQGRHLFLAAGVHAGQLQGSVQPIQHRERLLHLDISHHFRHLSKRAADGDGGLRAQEQDVARPEAAYLLRVLYDAVQRRAHPLLHRAEGASSDQQHMGVCHTSSVQCMEHDDYALVLSADAGRT